MSSITRRKFTELLALGALAGCTMPPAPKQQPVGWTLYSPDRYGAPTDALIPWRLVAMSDLIVRGTLTIPSDLELALAQSSNNFVTLPLSISRIFKGNTSQRLLGIRYWPGSPDGPTSADVAAASGREIIIFLMLPYADEGNTGPLYFARYSGSVLLTVSDRLEDALRTSIRHQATLASHVASYLADHVPPNDGFVSALVDQLLIEPKAYDAAQELLSLGLAYAAALVRHMDDRRPIATDDAVIPPVPLDLEGFSRWRPETVVDLISLALQGATSDRIGVSAGNHSERASRRVVDAWRVWLGRSLRLQAG